MINTTAIKDRSFVMNISNLNDISIETRNNKFVKGIAVTLTQKGKSFYALNIEFINGRFVRINDDDYLKLPKWEDLSQEERDAHEDRLHRITQEKRGY